MTNLINEPIFLTSEGFRHTLPAVLAALASGEDLRFSRVRPYQLQSWHSFLVQLTAIGMDRSESSGDLFTEEARWRDVLRELTDGDSGWDLVNDNLSQPAFMQPPVPEGTLTALKDGPLATPDHTALDLAFTGRAHDIKPDRFQAPEPEDWVHTLHTYQTMSGFGGRSNYGIARMNGGYASRPMLSLLGSPSQRFVRDVAAWRHSFDDRRYVELYDRMDGHTLLWVIPWDGDSALTTNDLHPGFIEICRRVRLAHGADGAVVAHRCGTKAPRVDAKALNGVTGDAWTPVSPKGTSLTVKGGFKYRLVHDLLFGDWHLPPSLDAVKDGPAVLELRTLEGGQGETAGLQVRDVWILGIAYLKEARPHQRFAKRSETQIAEAKKIASRVLRPAVASLLQAPNPGESLDLKDSRTQPVLDRFDRAVDGAFFERLFDDPEASSEDHLHSYSEFLRDTAREVYRHAVRSLPLPEARRERAVAAADALFYGGLRKHLPALHDPTEEHDDAA